MIKLDKLLDEALREIEKINEGKVFLINDLLKGYVWNKISRKDWLLLGTLIS